MWVISESVVGLSYVAVVMGALGLIALVLAAMGVYGVMAYSAVERTHEIGVRLALGAQQREILRLVLSRGVVLLALGTAIGLPISYVLARLLASLIFGVGATDAGIFSARTDCIGSYPARQLPRLIGQGLGSEQCDVKCDVRDVHDASLQFKTPFECDGVLRGIFRRDKSQTIWFVDVRHTETRTAVPTDLHGCNAIGIQATHNSYAASWADFQSDEIAGFEDSSQSLLLN